MISKETLKKIFLTLF
ncbi:hypothetical protein ACLSMT_001513 [Campylobacter jejuni]|nr:hypothetical protein [Campylobacter jejuni]